MKMKKMMVLVTMMMVLATAAFAKSKTKTTQMFVENNTGNTIAVVASNENRETLWENGYIIVGPGEVIVVEVDYTTKEPEQRITVVFNFDVETGVGNGGAWKGIPVLGIGSLSFTYGENGPRIQLKEPFAINGQRVFSF